MNWTVHKFGGSSLADADCFRRVAASCAISRPGTSAWCLRGGRRHRQLLFDLIERASRQQPVDDAMGALRRRHGELATDLLGEDAAAPFMEQFETDLNDIRRILEALALVKATSRRSQDMVSGFGGNCGRPGSCPRCWRFPAMAGKTCSSWIRGDVLLVEPGEMGPVVVWGKDPRKPGAALSTDFSGVAVITGYIARNPDGLQTTLGRNGSDYSASIFAALLAANAVHIWTDVDGVMSGDPRRVPGGDGHRRDFLQRSHGAGLFRCPVIHPQTMAPAVSPRDSDSYSQYVQPGAPGEPDHHVTWQACDGGQGDQRN